MATRTRPSGTAGEDGTTADASPNSTSLDAHNGADTFEEDTSNMTMAELELRRYIASQNELSETSTSHAGNAAKKRRRSARSSGGDGSGDHTGVDYHRVRTAKLTRLEEMFWKDDAGYDSEDDDEDEVGKNEEAEGADEDTCQEDGNDDDGSSNSDWRLIRRLPLDTWLRCDGNGCRRKAVATWIEVPSAAEDDDAKTKSHEGDDEPPEEKEEEEEEWNVCLACQKREFPDQIGPEGWPTYVDSVPMASSNTTADETKPPVHLNYGRRLHLTKIHDSPHIYIIDNFLTEGELKHIDGKIADAESKGTFEKSFVDKGDGHKRKKRRKVAGGGDDDDDDGGEEKKEEDGDDDGGGGNAAKDDGKRQTTDEKQRTSRFIHFGKMADSKIAAIETRAAELLQLPHSSIEPLQLVRYGPGQYFREHHDMGVLFDDGSVELPPRVLAGIPRRVVTILVYLNDLPIEAGGGTQFPYLSKTGFGMKGDDEEDNDDGGIVIHPKRGRAVVWANIDQTGWPDPRTVHEGMPLIRGAKMPSATAQKVKKEPKKKKEPKPKKAKKPRKSKKKAPPPPRPTTDQFLRYIVVPRSDPTNPLSSFGMKVASVGPDGRTVLTTDWEHPHMAQRLGLQLGRLKKDDVILSVNGHKVFDFATERVLLPFRVVVALIRATKPGRAMKLDVLRYAPKIKVEEDKGQEDGAAVDGDQSNASVSNEDTETSAGEGKAEAEVCNDNETNGDKEIEKVKSVDIEEACEENTQVKDGPKDELEDEPEAEPEPDVTKAKPLPLLKYAMNIWACEE